MSRKIFVASDGKFAVDILLKVGLPIRHRPGCRLYAW